MKGALKLSVLLMLVVLVVAAWAEERRYEVTITLTDNQIKQVKGGYGRDVTVEFTAAQIKAVQEVLPDFDLNEVTLTSSLLGRSKEILLVIKVFEDPRGRLFEANPQPSP
jgi:predicted nucleic acid-binding protein